MKPSEWAGAMAYQGSVMLKIIRHVRNWPSFFLAHFLQQRRPLVLQLRRGVKLLVRPVDADATMVMESWGYQVYTPRPLRIPNDGIVFDVGAHIGSFSSYAAARAPQGKVFAFEPFPPNFRMLQKNMLMNHFDQVTLQQTAIAAKKGTQTLHLYDGPHTGSSSLYHRNSDRTITIHATTIPDVMREHRLERIDLLKLDCEGAEYEILFSLPDNTLKKIRQITMEYHDAINEHRHPELLEFLKNKGFKVWKRGENIYAFNPALHS